MEITRDKKSPLLIKILTWDGENNTQLKWMTTSESASLVTDYDIFMLKAGKAYQLLRNGKIFKTERSNSAGKIHFSIKTEPGNKDFFEIRQIK